VTWRPALLLVIAALAGCGGQEERAAPAGPDPATFVADVDASCEAVRNAVREGPRFPYRDFDPSNPDGRLRAVGRFYRELDSEGTVTALTDELRTLDPPASLEEDYSRMLGTLEALVAAMRAQTRAALAGDRARTIEATESVETAFDELGVAASDVGAFLCALSLERKPKALR
jgi:hypothetical protein